MTRDNQTTVMWRRALVAALCGAVFAAAPVQTAHAQPGDLLERAAPPDRHASNAVLLAIARAGKRLVAVGERGIVLLSDDDGQSWRQAVVPVSVALTGVFFASANHGWAVGHGGVVLHSSDRGETWFKQLDGKQATQIELEAARSGRAEPDDARQRRIRNAERLVKEGPDKPILNVFFSDEQRGLIVGAYGLAFATEDGGKHWRSLMGEIDNPTARHLYAVQPAGSDLFIVGEQGVAFRSRDGGRTFVNVQTPYEGTYFGVVSGKGGEIVFFGLRGNAYRSPDGAASWHKVDTRLPVTLTAGLRLSDGSIVLVDETGRMLRSVDGGRRFDGVPISQPSYFTSVVETAERSLVLTGARGITRISIPGFLAEAKK